MRSTIIVCLTFFLPGVRVSADTLTLVPIKDNTLYEDEAGSISNGEGQYFFSGRTGIFNNTLRRGLIAFDVSAVPAGATILSASLTLNVSNTITGAMTMNLHRVTADWGEGESDTLGEEGAGTLAMPGDATWQHTFFDNVFWTTDGGDFAPAASATQMVAGLGPYSWSSAGMVADIQGWVAAPATNFGWILIGDEATIASAKRFDSRESLTPANQPRLTICYAAPGCNTCGGDLDGNNTANGADINAFVSCFLGGNPAVPGCGCADVDLDAAFTETDITDFVDKLLAGEVCCN